MIDYRRKTVIKGQQELRCGYTTGTCAAAAAKAAAVTLLSGEICRDVSLQLPGGEHIILETEFLECSENCVKCGMIKDAGDDPDITNGLLICAAFVKKEGEKLLYNGNPISLSLCALDENSSISNWQLYEDLSSN